MQKGFTLVEILVVFGVMGILFLILGSVSLNSLPKSQLSAEADTVEQTLRKAQAKSISQQADLAWGVHLTSGQITLFAGSTYVLRNVAYDEVHLFQTGIVQSGLSDIVFEYRTGETADTGTVTLTASSTAETKILTVNETGRVNKQ